MAVATNFSDGRRIFVLASPEADWNYLTDFPKYTNGIKVDSIQFIPSAYNTNIAIIKDGSETGPEIFYCASPNRFATKYFYGKRLKPYVDATPSCNYGASVNAKFIFTLSDD